MIRCADCCLTVLFDHGILNTGMVLAVHVVGLGWSSMTSIVDGHLDLDSLEMNT